MCVCVCVCVCVFNILEKDVLILFSFVWLLHGWCHMEFNIYGIFTFIVIVCILHTRKARQRLTNLHRLKTKSIGLEELNNSLSSWFRLDERMRELFSSSKFWQAGIAQWLEHQTHD